MLNDVFIHHDFKTVYGLNFIKMCFKFFIVLGFKIWLSDVYKKQEGDFSKGYVNVFL